MERNSTRRSFLLLLAGMTAIPGTVRATRARRGVPHPDPRPDIDASLVLTRDQLKNLPEEVKAAFDKIREIPQIADGIGCNCGCAAMPNYRSLLTCFYATGMARGCNICQAHAGLAYRRFKEGQSLAQIRRAIDARFG